MTICKHAISFILLYMFLTSLYPQKDSVGLQFDVTDLGYCDPQYYDSTQFAGLKEKFRGKRIILIGEQNHGTGNGYQSFAHFVRFLHEEMGFNVIAQEYCLFACGEADKAFQQGTSSQGYRKCMYWPQGNAAEMDLLFNYLDGRIQLQGERLHMEGFDSRIGMRDAFVKYAKVLFSDSKLPFVKTAAYPSYIKTLEGVVKKEYGDTVSQDSALAFLSLTDTIIVQLYANGASARDIQLMRSLRGFARNAWNTDHGSWRYHHREAQMFDNLQWLIDSAYPDEKFIVLMHNDHAHKGFLYMNTLGEMMHRKYGSLCANIGTTYYEGTSCNWNYEVYSAPYAKPGSFEDAMHKNGYDYAYADFSKQKDSFDMFLSDFNSWDWDTTGNFKKAYGNHFDGMIFIHTARAATPLENQIRHDWLLTQKLPPWALQSFYLLKADSSLSISNRINPYYLEADFNGDKKVDIAIAVKHKKSEKEGILILHGGQQLYYLFGAGTDFGNGGSNFRWMDIWQVYRERSIKGNSIPKSIKLKADGILTENYKFGRSVIYWDGKSYQWQQCNRE